MGRSQGPAYLLPLPPSLLPSSALFLYRIPLSGASGMEEREERVERVEGRGRGRLSTINVFFRNRLLLV